METQRGCNQLVCTKGTLQSLVSLSPCVTLHVLSIPLMTSVHYDPSQRRLSESGFPRAWIRTNRGLLGVRRKIDGASPLGGGQVLAVTLPGIAST